MKKLFLVLLFILIAFVQVDFAQKKFVVDKLSYTEGLQGKSKAVKIVVKITPYRITITDQHGITNEFVAVSDYFKFGREVTALGSGRSVWIIHMYRNTMTISEKGKRGVLWFEGTYYW